MKLHKAVVIIAVFNASVIVWLYCKVLDQLIYGEGPLLYNYL